MFVIWLNSVLLFVGNLSLDAFLWFIMLSMDMVPGTSINMIALPPSLMPVLAAFRRCLHEESSETVKQDLHKLVDEVIQSTLSGCFFAGTRQSIAMAVSLLGTIQIFQRKNLFLSSLRFADAQSEAISFHDLFLQIVSEPNSRKGKIYRALHESANSSDPDSHLALISTNDGEDRNVGWRFLHLLQSRKASMELEGSLSAIEPELHPSASSELLHIFLNAVFMIYDRDSIDEIKWNKIILSLSPVLQQLLQLIKSECLEEVDASWPPAVLAWIGRTDLFGKI